MSSSANASPSDALRSASRDINSEGMPNSRQRSTMTSFVSPSPGGSSVTSRGNPSLLIGQSSSQNYRQSTAPRSSSLDLRRRRSSGSNKEDQHHMSLVSGGPTDSEKLLTLSPLSPRGSLLDSVARAQSRSARKLNDSMVYLDGPQIYTCAQCRTHLTSHDDIISKSFHGRHGKIEHDTSIWVAIKILLSHDFSRPLQRLFLVIDPWYFENRACLPFWPLREREDRSCRRSTLDYWSP